MPARVLVVEDDSTMAEVLVAYLARAGYEVSWATDGIEAAQTWERFKPDVVILDIMLPGLSGLEVLRRRRQDGDHTAVIMLSARGEEEDRLVGLETGADDYVVKPFSPREVVLRVEALLRRAERLAGILAGQRDHHAGTGRDRLRRARGPASVTGDSRLTTREFDLLAFLAAHAGPDLQQGRAAPAGLGLGLRRHLHRDRPRSAAAGEGRASTRPIPRLVLTVGRAGYRMARDDELARSRHERPRRSILGLTRRRPAWWSGWSVPGCCTLLRRTLAALSAD